MRKQKSWRSDNIHHIINRVRRNSANNQFLMMKYQVNILYIKGNIFLFCIALRTARITHFILNVCLFVCFVCLMVFNATFNNISVISWRSVLLVEETVAPGENHRPVTSQWQTLSHNVVHLTLIEIWTHQNLWW